MIEFSPPVLRPIAADPLSGLVQIQAFLNRKFLGLGRLERASTVLYSGEMLSLTQIVEDNKKFNQESHVEFADGESIFREADESREMYVVLEGEVVITKNSPKGEIKLAHLHKGDFLGEMSLLESQPRSASATAKGAVRLLAIHPGGFLLKIRRDPTFAFEMLQTLSRRIRITNEHLIRELSQADAKSPAVSVGQQAELRQFIQETEYASPHPLAIVASNSKKERKL